MATMIRYKALWLAGSGGAGVSTFHFEDISGPVAASVRAFFAALAADLPTDVSISFPGEYEIVDIPTGELTGTIGTGAPASVVGTSTNAYAAPAGARVRWITTNFVRGRRVTGSTFIVPLRNAAYDVDGTLTSAFSTILNNAASTLRGATTMRVYSRPQAGLSNGSVSVVTGSSVPDRAAILRSRRD